MDLGSIGYYNEPWGTFYAYLSPSALGGVLVPIYRYLHSGDNAHFYSRYYGDIGPGWTFERIEFYVVNSN